MDLFSLCHPEVRLLRCYSAVYQIDRFQTPMRNNLSTSKQSQHQMHTNVCPQRHIQVYHETRAY